MSKPTVHYVTGAGWHYTLGGEQRGPFPSARDAALAMKREAYYLRACRRVEEKRPMTQTDMGRER